MGRALMAVIVLGLLAAGAWRLLRPEPAPGSDGAPPASGAAAPDGTGSEGTVPPPAGAPAAKGFAPAAPALAPAALAALVKSGDARGAVARARELPAGAFGDPALAAAARDAALALASGGASGPADRVLRADEARRLLGRLAVEDALPLPAVRERLDALNREVLFSGREVPGVVFRGTVKPGDSLDRLMKKEWKGRVRAGYGVVLWMNSVPSPDRLRAGGIWVPEEPLRILVRKRSHDLWVLLGGVPVRTFPVGLGMNGRTPEGEFEVEELMQRPDYWPPGGKRVPFGQKGNPLGTRWMGFRDTPEAQGFGIHGTDDPGSIGKDASQGCVRLRNEEVEQLFTWVSVGTKVEIRP
jgi:hypothetical protein